MSTEFPKPRIRARPATCWGAAAAFVLGAGCGSDGPGRLGGFDAGPRDAGHVVDGGGTNLVRPDGGPILPAADREVVLPYGDPATIVSYSVSAAPAMLDVHLSIDTTGSFVEEIGAVRDALTETVIPSIATLVPDASFGVSFFQDFPIGEFGDATDAPFSLLQRITNQTTLIERAVDRLPQFIGNGGDLPESGYEALYQAVTGAGFTSLGRTFIPRASGSAAPGGGTFGGVGFREDAFRVVVHATDAPSHVPEHYESEIPGTHGEEDVIAACEENDVRIVAITNGGSARAQMEVLAIATGAFVLPVADTCPTGVFGSARSPTLGVCPLVFDVLPDGRGLSDALVSAITRSVAEIRYGEVDASVSDDRLGFIEAVHAASAVPPAGADAPTTTDATPADGYDDTFVDVPAGTSLRFDVRLRNDVLQEQTYEQVFRVRVRIRADEAIVVDEWIRVVVPARN